MWKKINKHELTLIVFMAFLKNSFLSYPLLPWILRNKILASFS